MAKKPTYEELEQRVKALNCLYGISKIREKPNFSFDEVIQKIVDLIPAAWQFPEITCAQVILDGLKFRTKNFQETDWKLTGDITVYGDQIGTLEIFYLKEKLKSAEGPFTKEERSLINTIAGQLGKITESEWIGEVLRKNEQERQPTRVNSVVKEAIKLLRQSIPTTDENEFEPETEALDELPTGNERILLVDDEKSIVQMGQQMLEYLGYRVEIRNSPIEALECVHSHPEQFDLVITDQTMPHMTGIELAQKLRQIESNIPIILCTGRSEHIKEQTTKEMGIRAVVIKPVFVREMAETVRKVLDEK